LRQSGRHVQSLRLENADDEERVWEILIRFAMLAQARGIGGRDWCSGSIPDLEYRTGRIKKEQFVRCFPFAQNSTSKEAAFTAADLDLLIQRYLTDTGFVNLFAFEKDVDEIMNREFLDRPPGLISAVVDPRKLLNMSNYGQHNRSTGLGIAARPRPQSARVGGRPEAAPRVQRPQSAGQMRRPEPTQPPPDWPESGKPPPWPWSEKLPQSEASDADSWVESPVARTAVPRVRPQSAGVIRPQTPMPAGSETSSSSRPPRPQSAIIARSMGRPCWRTDEETAAGRELTTLSARSGRSMASDEVVSQSDMAADADDMQERLAMQDYSARSQAATQRPQPSVRPQSARLVRPTATYLAPRPVTARQVQTAKLTRQVATTAFACAAPVSSEISTAMHKVQDAVMVHRLKLRDSFMQSSSIIKQRGLCQYSTLKTALSLVGIRLDGKEMDELYHEFRQKGGDLFDFRAFCSAVELAVRGEAPNAHIVPPVGTSVSVIRALVTAQQEQLRLSREGDYIPRSKTATDEPDGKACDESGLEDGSLESTLRPQTSTHERPILRRDLADGQDDGAATQRVYLHGYEVRPDDRLTGTEGIIMKSDLHHQQHQDTSELLVTGKALEDTLSRKPGFYPGRNEKWTCTASKKNPLRPNQTFDQELQEILSMMRHNVRTLGLPLAEYMKDFGQSQRASAGHITQMQLARAMDICNIKLTDRQYAILFEVYCSKANKSEFDFNAFTREVDTEQKIQCTPARHSYRNPYYDKQGRVRRCTPTPHAPRVPPGSRTFKHQVRAAGQR